MQESSGGRKCPSRVSTSCWGLWRIPLDLLPQVFDLFRQGPDGGGRAPAGLGIGLALVKSLVELHGGSVAAHSAGTGSGAEFVVRLPGWARGAWGPGG
jgi:signal transduction histidine kinase